MLTLFYCPLACSMASHVALEGSGAAFEAKKIDIFDGEHLKPEYRVVNPHVKVPALRFDDGRVLPESTAILSWVGIDYPDDDLLGVDPIGRAQTIATCASALSPHCRRKLRLWISGPTSRASGKDRLFEWSPRTGASTRDDSCSLDVG